MLEFIIQSDRHIDTQCFYIPNSSFDVDLIDFIYCALVVEEAGVAKENHRPWASNW